MDRAISPIPIFQTLCFRIIVPTSVIRANLGSNRREVLLLSVLGTWGSLSGVLCMAGMACWGIYEDIIEGLLKDEKQKKTKEK